MNFKAQLRCCLIGIVGILLPATILSKYDGDYRKEVTLPLVLVATMAGMAQVREVATSEEDIYE